MVTWVVIFAAVALIPIFLYQILIARRINKKLSKLIDSASANRVTAKNHKEEAWQHYRQSEFYAQLLLALKPLAPIPALRSWAASPDLLLTLFHLTQKHRPRVIVDLGSGASTLVLAKAAPEAEIFSIDNSDEYANKTAELLKDHGITHVSLRVAPLSIDGSGIEWYQREAFADISKIDLLFVDGPPGSKNSTARHPAFYELREKLSPNAIVVIDDVNRDGEMKLAQLFAESLPSHSLEILSHEKGTAVIKPA